MPPELLFDKKIPLCQQDPLFSPRISFESTIFNGLLRLATKGASNLCIIGSLYEENPSVVGGFPSQRANNAERASMQRRHDVLLIYEYK